ncbi:MAG: hypothetical protein ACLRFE_04175 [Clostridia bacterium]
MRIIDRDNSKNEIVDLILSKARYQKVILCIDEGSDVGLIDEVVNCIGKDVVLLKYFYNNKTITSFHDMVNNGARVVVYNVSLEHFYKLQNSNNFVLNIFVAQSKFILPYINNVESVYGDSLLIIDTKVKDYSTLLYLYQLAFEKVWDNLLQGSLIDITLFKKIDLIANGKINFYNGILNEVLTLRSNITIDYQTVGENQIPYYIYLKLFAILKMLEYLSNGNEQYVDFYKTELSSHQINKAYNLLLKYDIIDTLKLHSVNMIKISNAILNRCKIIIKKYFNFKQIKLNKIKKLLNKNSKELKMENLSYISYIFNCI